MKRLLEEIESKYLAQKVTRFLNEEILRKVEYNEYKVETKRSLLTISEVNKLSRKQLAERFYKHVHSNGIKVRAERYANQNKLDIEEVTPKVMKLITQEIDYRLPLAYAQEYTGSNSKVIKRNFIASKGLKFKYKYGQERNEKDIQEYEERKETMRATKSQVAYLSNLLLRHEMSLSVDVKKLDKDTASALINHLLTGSVLDPLTQEMLIVH